ncbi:MAG: hypothetical protein KAT68_13095 [Bacteroidales bacterium]|nr:hypothetical protein [Bacteroidales bacterium]
MKKVFFCLLFLNLIIIQITNAQKNFNDGYILITENDTLYGQIDNKNYYLNSLYCDFKINNSDSIKKYYPNEIYGYRFNNGKYYISKNIIIEGKDSILFLEYLINGELDLFFLQDNGRINHYYASKDGLPLKELSYSKEIINIDGKLFEKESKKYVGILNYLTNDCPEVENDIKKINAPNHKKLIKFSENYHNIVCAEEQCVIYEKKITFQIMIEFVGGLKMLSYKRKVYSQTYNPIFGFNLYINNPRFSEKSYFGLGYINEGKFTIDSSRVSYYNFKIPITYGYFHPNKGLSPVFFGGMNIRNYENGIFTSVSLIPGIKYDFGRFFLKVYTDFEIRSFILIPAKYYSTTVGFSINYKIKYKDLSSK